MHQFPKAKLFTGECCSLVSALAQYTVEPAGGPPSEVAGPIGQALQKDGSKISNNGKAYCEIWFRAQKPSGTAAKEEGATLTGIPQGALLGVIRFDAQGEDRRGQTDQVRRIHDAIRTDPDQRRSSGGCPTTRFSGAVTGRDGQGSPFDASF